MACDNANIENLHETNSTQTDKKAKEKKNER